MIKRFMDRLEQLFGRGGRFAVLAGGVVIVAATAMLGYYLLRPDYQVLFADLTPQDMAAMTAELDRQKVPYILSDTGPQGATILVDRPDVYKTRLKLMGRDIPLHGAVGFELFNNSDFGMTEFAQKVNYQRALQGELIRTILSITSVRDVRVLLVLPEQGLLKQAVNKPKASITLTLKPDQRLRPEQVSGIQRLVASAVPGILTEDVTIVDQSGVALTRVPGDVTEAENTSVRLELKRDTETYLARKADAVLEQILGPGQALASVDVTLDMDRVQSSTDEVLGAPAKAGAAPTGVVVHEHEIKPEMAEPLAPRVATTPLAASTASSQHDVEYAVSHRVEQVVSQPGSIRRLQVAVVVKKPLTQAQQDQLRKTIAASVGVSAERGDTVVLQSLEAAAVGTPTAVPPVSVPAGEPAIAPAQTLAPVASGSLWPIDPVAAAASVLVMGLLVLLFAGLVLRRLPRGAGREVAAPTLTETQRQIALEQVRNWMKGAPAEAAPTGRTTPGYAPASLGGRAGAPS